MVANHYYLFTLQDEEMRMFYSGLKTKQCSEASSENVNWNKAISDTKATRSTTTVARQGAIQLKILATDMSTDQGTFVASCTARTQK